MSAEIIARLTAIEARLARIEAGLQAAPRRAAAGGAASAGGALPVADDRDLDGKHGDPTVKFDPKSWSGDSFVRLPFSQCSPEFLDCYAESLQWSSENPKAGKEKYASYDAKDAARARGWAARIRAGNGPAKPKADPEGFGAEDVPFGRGDAWEPPVHDGVNGPDDFF